jgi:ABC-type uncharacterized transport system substrate-binding protein
MRYWLIRLLLCIALGAMGTAAWAARFVILHPDAGAGHEEAADALTQELIRGGITRSDIVRLSTADLAGQGLTEGSQTQLIITLGADALRAALQRNPTTPVLASLIPRGAYERVLRESGGRAGLHLSAVFLDQPVARQLELIHLAMPEVDRVGVLWSKDAQPLFNAMQTAARHRGMQLVSSRVAARGEELTALAPVLADAQVLLALPDPLVFHSGSIANLLLATYRASIPLVGFSPSYVRAGALLSLYSTPRQIGLQTAQRALAQVASAQMPPLTTYPVDYTVEVNAHVARSLGRTMDASDLREKLHAWERRP